MLWPMFKRLFPALLLATASLAACTHVETAGGPPALPQVTAAAAVSRSVTEWDEFTGRLEPVQSVGVRPRVSGPVTEWHNFTGGPEPVQSVGVRPRVSGLISTVTFEEGSIVRQGQVLFQLDDRPFVTQVERLRAELAQAKASADRAASERQRADRLQADNAMSLEE